MIVIDWLQTCEFVRENSERFVLYCLCGCLAGICIILLTIIIILYIEKRFRVKDDYESPQTDILYDEAPSYLPVYRFNCRTHHDFHHI